MRPIDAVKVALLFAGIAIWFVGYRLDSRALMLTAIAPVVAAFALRFVKPAAK